MHLSTSTPGCHCRHFFMVYVFLLWTILYENVKMLEVEVHYILYFVYGS
jgi:hypothetical protein